MYKVTIRLEDGRDVYYTETSIIRAAARVEEYHENMLWCDIQQIREEVEKDARSGVHKDSD